MTTQKTCLDNADFVIEALKECDTIDLYQLINRLPKRTLEKFKEMIHNRLHDARLYEESKDNWQVINVNESLDVMGKLYSTSTTERLNVPGGWIVKHSVIIHSNNYSPNFITFTNNFVPDPIHSWDI